MSALGLSILILALIGHGSLLVALWNRVYAVRLPYVVLRLFRRVHPLVLIAGPVGLLVLLRSYHDTSLPVTWWIGLPWAVTAYVGLCVLVSVMGVPTVWVIRWRRRALPTAQLSNHSQVVDVATVLGRRPLGHGPHRLLAHLPGNEIFQIEVAEKQYRLPRLPRACDGLSIVHLSDLHYTGAISRDYFEVVIDQANRLRPDLVAVTGDLIDNLRCLEWLPATLGRLSAPLGCYFVLGNHDWPLEAERIRSRLTDAGLINLAGRLHILTVNGHSVVLAGTEQPWMGRHPELHTAPAEATRILLSHTPDNLPWARRQGFDLMLAGHLHGGQVQLPVWGPVYCPSVYGGRYVAGPYWEDPTLLYVNRGLSAVHPFRWQAKPEITKLILRSAAPSS